MVAEVAVAAGALVLRDDNNMAVAEAAYIRDGGDVVPVRVALCDVAAVAEVEMAVAVVRVLRDGRNVFPFLRASTLYQHVQVLIPLLLPELLRLRFLLLSL